MRKSKRPANPNNPAIDELGLNPDCYDAMGMPIEWTDPETGALMGGDPLAFAASADAIQIVGNPIDLMRGKQPTLREMTLDDIEDDCPACRINRERILAGDPPMAYFFE